MTTVADLLSGQSQTAPQAAAPPSQGPSVASLPPGFVLDTSDPAATAPPPPPPGFQLQSTPSGVGANIKAGAVEGLTGTIGDIIDAVNPINRIKDVASDVGAAYQTVADLIQGKPTGDVLGKEQAYQASLRQTPHKLNQAVGAVTGYNPENITATTFPERLARGVSSGVTSSLLLPGAEGEGALSTGIKNAAMGVGAGAGSATASEVAPEGSKEAAGFLGGLAGGAAVGAAETAAPSVGSVVQGASDAATAGIFPAAAERQAGRTLAARATDPDAAAAALEKQGERVPGSQPTTFQQSGDTGLGSLEREVATRNQPAFQQRAGEQNAARVQALGSIQKGADPNDVAATLRQHFDDLDARTQADVEAKTAAAQTRAAAMGGEGNPEDQGSQIRAAVNDAEDAARQRERGLWRAVDPTGDLTGNVSQTIQAANDISEAVPPTAKPMSGEEAAIFDAARSMSPLTPVADLIALRSRVSTEMRNELINNGASPTYSRLTQLRGAIQDNLANTIAQKVSMDDAAVARGMMRPEEAISARLISDVQQWRDARSRGAIGEGDLGRGGGGSAGAAASAGAEGEAAGGPGGPAGNQGLQDEAPGVAPSEANPSQPTFDEAAAERLAAATTATKERARTFGQQPLAAVIAKSGTSDQFRLNEGLVPRKIFHPGASGYKDLRAYLDAVGEERGLAPVVDYAATSLRRAATNPDGTLDPAKFATWQKVHTDALRAFPENIRAQFADAASAAEALADAKATRTVALKEAQMGALGRVMKLSEPEDVTKTIGSILSGRTAVADMKQLAIATRGDPDARAGLRQAVANYVASKFLGNTEVGTSGTAAIRGDAFQSFVKNSRAALHLVFSPEEVRTMEAVAEDIQRANRSVNSKPAGTPGTAHDALAGFKMAATKHGGSMLDLMAGLIGEHHGGLVGGVAAAGLTHLAQMLRAAGIAKVDHLVTEAMLNPRLAAELLRKAPEKPTPMSFRPIASALVKSVVPASARARTPG